MVIVGRLFDLSYGIVACCFPQSIPLHLSELQNVHHVSDVAEHAEDSGVIDWLLGHHMP